MAMIKKTVSVYGTEQEFIEAVYDAFLEIDGVTMNPTKENLSTIFINSSSVYATFTLTYKGITIQFKRAYDNNDTAKDYRITVNGADIDQFALNMKNNSASISQVDTRTWSFELISNDNTVKLIYNNYDNSNSYNHLFVLCNINNEDAIFYSKTTNLISGPLSSEILYPLIGYSTSCKLDRILNYTVANNGIDIFDGAILVTHTNSEKVKIINNLKTCTIVPANSKLMIDDEEYYSVGTDTIIKI